MSRRGSRRRSTSAKGSLSQNDCRAERGEGEATNVTGDLRDVGDPDREDEAAEDLARVSISQARGVMRGLAVRPT